MTLALIFWIIMLVWLVFSLWLHWSPTGGGPYPVWANSFLLFILFLILGWGVFGAPIRG